MNRSTHLIRIAVSISLTVLAGLAQAQTPLEIWQSTLVIAAVDEPQTFDSHVNVTQIGGQRIFPNVYESLVQYDENGAVVPMLATAWTVSDDGLTYVFELREGVRFSDGTPFDAAAVVFAFERLRAINKGPVNVFAEVRQVEATGSHEVTFTLSAPFAPFLSALASWQGALYMSPSYVAANAGDDFGERHMATHTAGTGPFVVERWQPESQIVMVRNPHYWGEFADDGIQRVVYRTIRESATAVQALRRGDVDIIERLATDFVPSLEGDENVAVQTRVSLGGSYGIHIHFNSMLEPFTNPDVRRALSYAIDYDRIVTQMFGAFGKQASGALPDEFVPWFSADSGQYSYDPERASAMLAAAGFVAPAGGFTLGWQAGNANQRDMGQIVQENLRALGIGIELIEMPLPVWREEIWKNRFELIFVQFSLAYADPDARMWRAYHSSEFRQNGFNPGWLNETYDALLEDARANSDPAARKSLYDEAQALLVAEAPTIFLVNTLYTFAHRSSLEGVSWIPAYGPFFSAVRISKDPAGAPR